MFVITLSYSIAWCGPSVTSWVKTAENATWEMTVVAVNAELSKLTFKTSI